MRKPILRRNIIASFLIILALALVAIRPWLRRTVICSDDFGLHLLRAAQLKALLQEGVLYSRWAPAMAMGYGYPLYNFYAPLSYYIAAFLSLTGLKNLDALYLTFALAFVGAGLGAYRLAREHLSPRSALLAAVAYMYAPYLGYDAFFRGNLAETLGWVFPPFALWAIGRLARGRESAPSSGDFAWTGRYIALTALLYAAVLLTHNVFSLIFSPLLLAYGLATALFLSPKSARPRRLLSVVLAVLLGLGLAAFFWLPALAERGEVLSHRLLVPPDFVYWGNFIPWKELFTPPLAVHPDLMNPSPPRGVGLLPALIGLPGLLGLWRFRDRPRRLQVAFFAAALAFYAWMTNSSSRVVWDHLPLIEYVQFPWRMLGPAALCLAVVVAAAADLLPAGRRGVPVVAGAMLLLVLGDLFWLDPRYCPWAAYFDRVERIVEFERQTNLIGTTAKGEYLPRWVERIPADPPAAPLDTATVPPDTTVVLAKERPIGAELIITAGQPFTATYNGFYYPGWQVKVDGNPVPILPEPLYGRITFPVPAGTHRVSVRFGETPLRAFADVLSFISLVVAIGLLWVSRRYAPATDPLPSPSPAWAGWGLALFGLVLLLQRVPTPLIGPALRDGRLPGLDTEVNLRYEGGMTLLGFQRFPTTIAADQRFRVDLYWTAWRKPTRLYAHEVQILDANGLQLNRRDRLPPREFRSPPGPTLWEPGLYAHTSHTIEPLPGTPPGVYDLALFVFDRETLVPQRILGPDGQPGSSILLLGSLTVTRPNRMPRPEEAWIEHRLSADLGPLVLVGFDPARAEVAAGDPLPVTLFWSADEAPRQDLTVRLSLVDAGGSAVAAFDLPPTSAAHPTSSWQAGDFWRGRHVLYLPARLEGGDYTWRVTLLPIGRSADIPVPLRVTAPARTFRAPPVRHPIGITLGNRPDGTWQGVATLVGFDVAPEAVKPGDTLTVTLVWRAEAETRTSYRVFLHMRAADGALIAQADGVPADWSRPTTGWVPGEYIVDRRVLFIPSDAPSGPYTLSAGLYAVDPISLLTTERLIAPDGADTLQLIVVPASTQ